MPDLLDGARAVGKVLSRAAYGLVAGWHASRTLDKSGTTAYVCGMYTGKHKVHTGRVEALNIATNQFTSVAMLGFQQCAQIAVSPDEHHLAATGLASNQPVNVDVVRLSDDHVASADVNAGEFGAGVVFGPDSGDIYLQDGSNLSTLDTVTLNLEENIPLESVSSTAAPLIL